VKPGRILLALHYLLSSLYIAAQDFDRQPTLSVFGGMMNYQGDLNPNSFSFQHSNPAWGMTFRKPLTRWFTARAAIFTGMLTAADRWNRDYLQPRNLSFNSRIVEATVALELTVFNPSSSRVIPYLYGGLTYFHFNPWAYDNAGTKTFLKPLSTEGQGLPEFPSQKPYSLYQWALPFGGGIKYALSDAMAIGIDFSQRKTFTDYLDDVSSHYVDPQVLENAKGHKAVEMAYRADEIPGGMPAFPAHGDQRGTPSEMDWYYYLGINLEVKLNELGSLFNLFGRSGVKGQDCPRVF
jgi:hypothetical protein